MFSYEKNSGYNSDKKGVKCMICRHYCFKDKFDYQPYICSKYHDFPMSVMDLSEFFIWNDYRKYTRNVNKKEAINIFKNADLDDKAVSKMKFNPNFSPVDVIKKGTFGGTFFRDIYSNVTSKFYKKSWKEFKKIRGY